MKIAFLGNFNVDHSSESHYLKTLLKMGHEVSIYQENSSMVDVSVPTDIDMFFWIHTHGWQTPGIGELMLMLKARNTPIVSYHLDLWVGIDRIKDLDVDPYWKYVDYFFTADKNFVPELEKRGIKAYYLPAGVYEDECYLAESNRDKYPHDIVFVGSRNYHHEWPYRKQLIEWLESTYGDRFAQYGGGGKGTIRGYELNALYSSAKVVVGDTLCKDFNYPDYFSDRLFETTGRGGFLIFPNIKGLDALFEIDKEMVTYEFGNMAGLKQKVNYYLSHDEERETIRLTGHNRAKRDHTYTQRLSYLLNTVQNDTSHIPKL